jgi:tetratricopeptide (TPR) repeat protein
VKQVSPNSLFNSEVTTAMKKFLSGIVIHSLIIAAFSLLDISQRSIVLAATLLSAIRQNAPLTLSQLEALIKHQTPDSAIAIEIQQRGLAFQLTANQLAVLKQHGAGLKTIRALQARLKKVVKPSVLTLSQDEAFPFLNKVIILVANFDGPNPQEYRVTEHIIEQLTTATKKYSDIDIQALAETITVQQGGSEAARAIGTKRNASIVLWGWYAANQEAGSIHTYFEVLRKPKCLCISQNLEKQIATISELRGFKIQTQLSGEMTYLTLLTLGLARYESGDYDEAIDLYTTAMAQSNAPDQIISPAFIYLCRGIANYYNGGINGIDKAIADYDQAIKINPDFADAYINRGAAYADKGEYDRTIADFNQAINIKPDYADAYFNRGVAYGRKGKYDQAITDVNQAIKLKPNEAKAYLSRAIIYKRKGEPDRAIADSKYVLEITTDPDLRQRVQRMLQELGVK